MYANLSWDPIFLYETFFEGNPLLSFHINRIEVLGDILYIFLYFIFYIQLIKVPGDINQVHINLYYRKGMINY